MTKNSPTRSTRPAIALFRSPVATIRNPQRRGILLLVVLSLLVLFLLVGTSFITSSNNHRLTSKTLSRPYEAATNPLQHTDLLDQTLNQLVRDSSNPYSSLAGHSLLNDLYGLDGVLISPTSSQSVRFVDRSGFQITLPGVGLVNTANLDDELLMNTGNQFFWAAVVFDPSNSDTLNVREDFYKGRIFTLLDGPAAGRSARVIRYLVDPSTNQALFYLMLLDSDRNFSAAELDIQPNHVAVINGQPFNGTGAGYNVIADPNGPLLNATERVNGDSLPLALMPDTAQFDPNAVDIPNYGLLWTGIGGADESYDAVDFQNMALAWSPVNPTEIAPNASNLGDLVIPSFHRPALINYWGGQVSTLAAEPNILRKILLRPFRYDHPNFTGSNTEYEANFSDPNAALRQMVYGPWDVDNDGDGRRDSVWVDAGLPVMEGPQGVLVKPLVAILCIDLDSRLNLNAHGTLDLAGLGFDPPPVTLADGVSTNALAEGQGYGPAEISLQAVLEGDLDDDIRSTNTESLFTRILVGVPAADGAFLNGLDNTFTQAIGGRYGHRWQGSTWETPGVRLGYDLLAQLKQQGMPQHVVGQSPGNDPNDWLGNYATPPDLNGRYALGLDALGLPVYEAFRDPSELDIDSPYELNLSRLGPQEAGNLAQDGPFTVAELEKILRAYDKDSGKLPSRLWDLANGFVQSGSTARIDAEELQEWRGLLTTDSFDIPVANVTLPEWMLVGPDGIALGDANDNRDDFASVMGRRPVNLTFADLLEYRVRVGLNLLDPTAITPADLQTINQVMRQLLAPELAAGERFDLNRPFGNGRDDNNNGVVDEPGEWRDADNDGVFDNGEIEAPFWALDSNRTPAGTSNSALSFQNQAWGQFRDNIDRDGDGDIEPWERGDFDSDGELSQLELVKLHNFRRQLYARHLYVLAMTLVDPIVPPVGTSDQQIRTLEKQRAVQLAQWAINVADFRDPDNISTAFEYDIDPFDGWGWTDTSNSFRLIDGDLSTVEDVYGADNKYDTSTSVTGDNQDQGGIVWGLERPDVLMTETLSWHDRATEDRGTGFEDAVTDENLDGKMDSNDDGEVGTLSSAGRDTDFDQRVRPQGATFIELFNPYPESTAANATTHLLDNSTGRDLGIDLARVSQIPHPVDPNCYSPVWRINVRKTVDYVIVNGNPNESLQVGGPDRDPDDPDNRVQPLIPDRCIYFTNFDPEKYFPINAATGNSNWDDDGVAFYSSLTTPRVAANANDPNFPTRHAVVRPGRYLVVGSGSKYPTSADPDVYEARIGARQSGTSQPHRGVVLDPFARGNQPSVTMQDDTGSPVTDQDGFEMSSTADMTSVAIIDSTWFRNVRAGAIANEQEERRRFSVSEPATGYPDGIFNSEWTGSGTGAGAFIDQNAIDGIYKPTLDIPLDNQRSAKRVLGADNVIDGQSVIGTTKVRWFRRANNTERIPSVELRKDNDLRLTLSEREEAAVRTIPAFSWLYLQRLANPLLPWNPEPFLSNGQANPKHVSTLAVNPYRTVDSMATNVTVFTGQADREKRRTEDDVVLDYNNAYAMDTFASLQRGRGNENRMDFLLGRIQETQGLIKQGNIRAANTGFRHQSIFSAIGGGFIRDPHANGASGGQPVVMVPGNLWGEERVGQVDTQAQGLSSDLRKPFGLWINRAGPAGDGLKRAVATRTHFMNSVPDSTLGFLNEPFRNQSAPTDKYTPDQPFSWMTWNNRPFISSGELLQVPTTRSSMLMKTASFAKPGSPSADNQGEHRENYGERVRRGQYPQNRNFPQYYPELVADGPYGHLPNFFRTRRDQSNGNRDIVGLYRLLDYVTVPSRYVGTETWLSPVQFGSINDPVSTADARYALQPPFNKVALNRDPGRVNINTIGAGGSGAVWFGMFHGRTKYNGENGTHAAINDDGFFSVRRGYGVLGEAVGSLNAAYPTLVGNPFRSSGAAAFVPLPQMLRREIEGTTMRSMGLPQPDTSNADPNQPVFDDSNPVPQGDPVGVALLSAGTNSALSNRDDYRNSDRNAYFRYDPLKRITSMATTHSNVYAVWITIGFFEVSEAPAWNGGVNQANFGNNRAVYNRVYPEGYQFGREYGIDTGSEVRLRQFAIVDRSIPVAFEPGKNHNTEKAIRLKRRIE